MHFQETYAWIMDKSPHTGKPKTHTRRPKKTNETAIRDYADNPDGEIVEVTHGDRIKWRVGRWYAVQPGRGKRAVGYFQLKRIRLEPVSDISPTDARAEGFSTVTQFFNIWRKLYPQTRNAFGLLGECWVLEWEKVRR